MKLPHPFASHAGCCWLPRLIAKTKARGAGDMPWSYRIAYGSKIGVDGHFLRHFRLTIPQLTVALRRARTGNEAVAWFLAQPTVNADSIAQWNKMAGHLGRRGQPGHRTFQIVRWLLYPKSILSPVDSIFDAIAQDENLSTLTGPMEIPPDQIAAG